MHPSLALNGPAHRRSASVRTETTISWAPTVCQALPRDLKPSQLPAGSSFWLKATQLVSGGAGIRTQTCRTRHWCPGAAVTNGPEPGLLNNRNLLSHSVEVCGPRLRCRQGRFLWETPRRDLPRRLRRCLACRYTAAVCFCLPSVLLCPQSPCSSLSW